MPHSGQNAQIFELFFPVLRVTTYLDHLAGHLRVRKPGRFRLTCITSHERINTPSAQMLVLVHLTMLRCLTTE
jgi:hypothetical protein